MLPGMINTLDVRKRVRVRVSLSSRLFDEFENFRPIFFSPLQKRKGKEERDTCISSVSTNCQPTNVSTDRIESIYRAAGRREEEEEEGKGKGYGYIRPRSLSPVPYIGSFASRYTSHTRSP